MAPPPPPPPPPRDDSDEVVDEIDEDDDIRMCSRPRPLSVRMSGVVERWMMWPRWGFKASRGGDVRKFTGADISWGGWCGWWCW